MSTVSLGPFVLEGAVFLFFSALLVAMAAAVIIERFYKLRLEPLIWWAAIAGIVAGRLSFVLEYWPNYHDKPLSMIDIRDGGMTWQWGLLAVAVVVLIALLKQNALGRRGIALCLLAGLSTWGAGYAYLNLQYEAPKNLPSMSLLSTTSSREHIQLDSYRGQPMVLNLWATWCPPCRREMPVFEAAQQQYKNVHFVFANQMESAAKVLEFLDNENLVLSNLLQDESGKLAQFARSRGLPTTLFIDESGQVRHIRMGEVSEATLRHQLNPLLSIPE